MDTLTAVLDGHRARGAHVLQAELAAPWSIAVEDGAAVGVLVMVRGEGHLERDGADPLVDAVLSLRQADPGRAWSLASLAREVAVSRATLARRFTELVGRSPMAYLAEWRLSLAAELLRGSDASVEQVARQVGYVSPFAFSTAFKKAHGLPPRAFRLAASA